MDNKFIGKGQCGKCYELENGNVLKIFNRPKSISELKKYKTFLNYKNETIVFPHEFVTTMTKLKGHISKKVYGHKLDTEEFKLYKIDDMYRGLFHLEKDIDFISNSNIRMIDTHSGNIFYNGSKFSIIDVDSYQIYDNLSDRIIYKNTMIIKEIFYNLFISSGNIKSKSDLDLLLRKYIFWDSSICETVYEFKNIIEKYYKNNIETIDDIKRLVK